MGRTIADFVFAELRTSRRREVMSAIAHYIAGVLDRESMVEIVESLCEAADLKPGDHVKTLRGTARGVVLRILEDGRLVWKVDGSGTELISLPESLIAERAP